MRTLLATVSLLLTATGTVVATAPPALAAPAVDVRPQRLPAGPAPQVPYVEGSVVVDGDRRIETGAAEVRVLGTAGDDIVVAAVYDARSDRVLRLRADGTETVLATGSDLGSTALSDDGSELVTAAFRHRRTTLRLVDAFTGAVAARRALPGYVDVHDVSAGRVVLGTYEPARTLLWRTGRDTLRTVLRRAPSYADLGSNRLAWFDGDPYDGGCQVLARISDPTKRVWRSCQDAVTSISPDGSRLLTLHKLTDGLGPGVLRVRDARGRLLATYRTDGWFPDWQWESDRSLLLETNSRRRYAVVRCTDGSCERATALAAAQSARVARNAARTIGIWSGSRP